jgi:hypothetical protein
MAVMILSHKIQAIKSPLQKFEVNITNHLNTECKTALNSFMPMQSKCFGIS